MAAPVLIFPGQATEAVGMSSPWPENPIWSAVMAAAERHSGYALRTWMAAGPLEVLKEQRHAPVAVLSHSVALFSAQRAAGMPLPCVASGHSMGFFSAVVAAGVVPLEACLDLFRAVEDEAEVRFGKGTMGMAFVIGLKEGEVRAALAGLNHAFLSNVNGSAQMTVSGAHADLVTFVARVEPHALKAGLLPVQLPLHAEPMAPLLPYIASRLSGWQPRDPAFPLISPLDGRVIESGFEAWEETQVSLASAIRWPAVVAGLKGFSGPWLECGFGAQLSNLSRWVDRELKVESLQEVRVWREALGE